MTSKQSALFHLFLSGSVGCGKLHLIKTVFHAVNKVFLYRSGDPAKPRVLSLAPTGVAAIKSMVIQYILICIYHVDVSFFQ